MKPKLGVSVPSGENEDEIEDVLFVLFGEKSLEYRNYTLSLCEQAVLALDC
jgi:hypothetical protein